jgi:hypothetical protein
MTKFILVLYSCSFLSLQCGNGTHTTQHETWHECAKQGYLEAHKMMEIADIEEVNKNRLAVKFECKEIYIKPQV